jgi:hypothetical protein
MIPMKRRIFLKGVGGACMAAPFLASVHEQWAKAQGTTPTTPTRLVVFFTHNGCLTNRWFPTKMDGALEAADLTGKYLEVLAPLASKLLIPRGFRSMNPYAFGGQSIDPHDQAMGSKLTCSTIDETKNRYPTAESLDHTIAKQINPNAGKPLVLGVGAASTSIKEVLSFSGPTTAYPANTSPQTVYQELSGVLAAGGSGTGGGPVTPADYHVARGQSVIDLVKDDLASYQRLNMSQADQGRIQDWLDLFRDTEVGVNDPALAAACNMSAGATYGATPEAVAEATPTGTITMGNVLGPKGTAESDANLAISFTKGTDMMQNLMALNMICDTNRMLMLVFPGYITFKWDGMMHTHEAHGLSHRTGDFTVGGACGVDGVLDMLADIDTWYTSKYARLVNLLESIGEGDGKLLDHTATMWLPELSDGAAHNLNNLPIVIAGGASGYLKTGAIVKVDQGNMDNGNSEGSCANGGNIGSTGSNGGNLPINKLYVTLMNAVGCKENGGPVTKFGVFDDEPNSGITNPGEVTSIRAAV